MYFLPEEQIDIVNENNEPTGQVMGRGEAHERGLWHRTVHVHFYRVRGGDVELLVHLRSARKDSNPNKWDTRFGGHVKAGYTILEGTIDEVRDEVGITALESDLLEGDWSTNYEHKHFSKNYFYQFGGDTSDLRFSDGEVQAVKWMTLPDIASALAEHPEQWTQRSESFAKMEAFLRERAG